MSKFTNILGLPQFPKQTSKKKFFPSNKKPITEEPQYFIESLKSTEKQPNVIEEEKWRLGQEEQEEDNEPFVDGSDKSIISDDNSDDNFSDTDSDDNFSDADSDDDFSDADGSEEFNPNKKRKRKGFLILILLMKTQEQHFVLKKENQILHVNFNFLFPQTAKNLQ
jgi:hypothetical protein